MTVDDLVDIVCTSLDEIGIKPQDSEEDCDKWTPKDLDLDDAAVVQLLMSVSTKVKAQGQTVVVGKTMWRRSKSVRDFCEALAENLE